MKVMVNGSEKKLVARGKNGIEWTADLLGGYNDVTVSYDSNGYPVCTMDEEAFIWWDEEIDKLNQITELEETLSGEQAEEYWNTDFSSADLETETDARLEYLKSL